LIAVTLVIILAATVIFTYGLLTFSSVVVEAYSVTPTESGQQENLPLTVGVFSNGQKIGESFSSIKLLPGKHTLAFADCSSDYSTPSPIEVGVPFFQSINVEVLYYAKWGMLVVTTTLYDDYNQTSSPSECTIFVDGQPLGNGSIVITYNATGLGEHVVAFANLDGYTAPNNRTVQVVGGQTTLVQEMYHKQLTSDEEMYVWARGKTSYEATLDPQSNVVTDRFLQWTLNSKTSIPFCFFYLYYESMGEFTPAYTYLETYISQYAGILPSERVSALINIYNLLKSDGLDIRQGNSNGVQLDKIESYHYVGQSDYIVTVNLRLNLHEELVEKEEGTPFGIMRFNRTDLSEMIRLLPGVIPVGFAYDFGSSYPQLFVMVGSSTEPIRDVYTSFSNFSGVPQNYTGGYFTAWDSLSLSTLSNFYFSNSFSQVTQIVSALVMGTVLVDPAGFCSNLLWEK
jgi:hypothetical protein